MEVELRQQVVNNFAEKHIKQVISSTLTHEFSAKLKEEIRKEINGKLGAYINGWGFIQEGYNIEIMVRKQLEKAVNDACTVFLENGVEKWNDYIDRKIQQLFDRKISDLVNAEFEKRLKQLSQNE